MATVFTEGRHAGEFLLSEANFHRSRETVTIGASQTILAGTLLAMMAVVASTTATAAAVAGNTGNGTLTMADPAVSTKVKDGVYMVTCVTAAANGGVFRVEDPKGVTIGNATVGSAFNKEVKFTIADGATDFAVGDSFTITVAVGASGRSYVAHAPSATDGTEIPAAIALYPVTTGSGETAQIAAIARDAEVKGAVLSWASGISAGQKVDATQALAEAGIIVR